MSTAQYIRERIEHYPVGEPFTLAMMLEGGSRASVDQSLSRLVKSGYIERLARGVFVRPVISRHVGKVMPEAIKVAQVLAESTGAVVQVHGAEAARRFGLTTQMPTQSVFSTSGPSRRLKLGKMEVRLQHVSARKLAMAGRPAGLALAALWYLGKSEVSPTTIGALSRKLAPQEFEALKSNKSVMPAWMSDVFIRFEQASMHV